PAAQVPDGQVRIARLRAARAGTGGHADSAYALAYAVWRPRCFRGRRTSPRPHAHRNTHDLRKTPPWRVGILAPRGLRRAPGLHRVSGHRGIEAGAQGGDGRIRAPLA